jgi:hypothetical protein
VNDLTARIRPVSATKSIFAEFIIGIRNLKNLNEIEVLRALSNGKTFESKAYEIEEN